MIRQNINVDNKWRVIVYYDINYNLFHYVKRELENIGVSERSIKRVAQLSFKGEVKAFTFSNYIKRISIVGFNKHKTTKDYINSIVHEAEHIKQHMLETYHIIDKDEPPAYTIGYVSSKMIMFFLDMVENYFL